MLTRYLVLCLVQVLSAFDLSKALQGGPRARGGVMAPWLGCRATGLRLQSKYTVGPECQMLERQNLYHHKLRLLELFFIFLN